LTSTPDSGESAPRWSPDGRYLAFLASRGSEEEKKKGAQVWLLNMSGGEAQKLTDVKGGVSEYAWSPDGRRLVLGVSDPDPDAEPENKEGWKRKTKPPIVIDRYHFKQDGAGYLTALYRHLATFEVESRKVEALTAGRHDETTASWSPDGKWIAFLSDRTADPDRGNNTDVYVVEARAGAEPRRLTAFPGPDGGRPAWSPDGQWIAYLQGDEPRFSAYNLNRLAVVPAAGGEPRIVSSSLDRAIVGSISWSADGRSLTSVVQDDRITCLATAPVAGGEVRPLTSGRRTVSSVSKAGEDTFALLAGTGTEPYEVHVFEKGALRRLTHENDKLLGELSLSPTEDFTAKAKDGAVVNGVLVKPTVQVSGQKYPMLLLIHGGPNGQDEHSFSFDRQFFAANGYVVVSANYRGSAGRGSAYQKAIYADWGHLEVVDLLAAVDHVVAGGIADPERLGIGGWSYGGILTDYTIATDRRFKAAVSGASSALQLTMYGTDQYTAQYDQELGPPWKAQETWLKVSYPFFHADRITTPTLFMCGLNDFNVPIAGVEQMYQALKSAGVETELVIYPGQNHG
ncbi:MAG: S9 family peptidase, partial [Acidobacteria bacterium]